MIHDPNEQQKTRKRKKPRVSEESSKKKRVDGTDKPVCPVSYEHVRAGDMFLGSVSSIQKKEVNISLPWMMRGKIKCSEQTPAPSYHMHQLVPCVVLSSKVKNQGLELSAEPKLVNRHHSANTLTIGACIVGSVSRSEKNGYVIDFGISGVVGFLPASSVLKYLLHGDKSTLDVGSVALYHIRRIEKKSPSLSLLTVTANPEVQETDGFNIFPGARTKATVTKTKRRYLQVHIAGEEEDKTMSYVDQENLSVPWEDISAYSVGDVVSGRIVACVGEALYITCVASLVHPYTQRTEVIHARGTQLQGEVMSKNSVWLTVKLEDGNRGVMRVCDENDSLSPGDVTTCCITHYNYINSAYNITYINTEDVPQDSGEDVQVSDGPGEESDSEKAGLDTDVGFSWNKDEEADKSSDEDSDDDVEDDAAPKEKKKLSRNAQKVAKKAEEQSIFNAERLLMDNERRPDSVEDYERLVLASPNSSLCWIKYITFYMQAAEVERARALGQRALKTINFREEQEKLNVWVALINIENLYGTQESLNTVIKDALQCNDQLSIYKQLATMYADSDKLEKAELTYKTMLKKFKKDKEIWVEMGRMYMRAGQWEAGRGVMQRSLQSVHTAHHIWLIVEFARLEFEHGDKERGKTLFQQLLNSYPKRTDLWSVYTDILIKYDDIPAAREMLERSIGLVLNPRKMKFLFKKYLNFEISHGSEEQVEAVRLAAKQYVLSKSSEDGQPIT